MQLKRDGERTSLAKIRKASILDALREALRTGSPAKMPPDAPTNITRYLRQLLGPYVDSRQLKPLINNPQLTAHAVRHGGNVRYIHVGHAYYYSLQDIHRFLASTRP